MMGELVLLADGYRTQSTTTAALFLKPQNSRKYTNCKPYLNVTPPEECGNTLTTEDGNIKKTLLRKIQE